MGMWTERMGGAVSLRGAWKPMRRVNKKLVAVLVLLFVVGVVVPGAWLLHRQHRRPDVAPVLRKAEELLAADKLDEAVIQYERVLRLDPRCAAAHQALGKLAEDRDDLEAALGHYQRAARHDPDNRAVLTRLGALGERLKILDPIRTAADRLLALDPENPEAHCWKALVLNAENHRDKAIEEAEKATALDPSFAKGFLVLSGLHRADQRYELAESALQRGLEAQRENVELLLALGHLHESRGDGAASAEKARAAYDMAVQAGPDRTEPRLRLAALLARQGLFDEAEQQLQEAARRHPKDQAVLGAYAAFLDGRGRADEAEAKLRAVTESNPGDRAPLLAYARHLAAHGKLEAARQRLEEGLRRFEHWPEGRVSLVEVLLKLRETQPARKAFDQLPRFGAGRTALLLLEGRLLLAEGKPAEAVAKLNQVIARDATDANAHLTRGLAFTRLGALGSAQSSFQEAARHAPNSPDAQRSLAVASLRLGQFATAAAAARRYADARPDDVAPQRLLGRALAANGDIPGAVERLEALARQGDDPAEIVLELADVHASAGRYDKAVRVVLSASPEVRSSVEARLMLARIYRTNRVLDRAEDELLEVCKAAPHDVRPRGLLASVHYQRSDIGKAMEMLEAFAKAESASVQARLLLADCHRRAEKPDDAARVCYAAESLANDAQSQLAIAQLYRRLGRLDDALRMCREAQKSDPDSEAAAELRVDVLLALKRPDEALAVAKRIAAAKPHRLAAALMTPRVLVAEGKLEEAIPLLRKLATEHPHEAAPAELLGRAYFLQKEYRQAIEQLRRAASVRPNDPQTCFLLAEACFRNGDYSDAITWSERALARAPHLRHARVISALSHARRKEYGEAIEEYLAAAPARPGFGYFLGLADLYKRDGKTQECEKALLDAYRLEPDSPPVVLSLARYYEGLGKPDRAEMVIKEFLAQNDGKPAAHLVAADHHRAGGRQAEAEKAYRRATELDPKSPDLQATLGGFLLATGKHDEACETYRAAVRLGMASARAKVVEALRRAGKIREAGAELAEGLAKGPAEASLYVEQARLLLIEARRGGGPAKLAACRQACRKALKLSPDAWEAHLIVADAILAAGADEAPAEREQRQAEALASVKRAVEVSQSAPSALLRLADLQLRLGRANDAEWTCRRALATARSQARVWHPLARTLLGQDKLTEAEDYLRRAIDADPGSTAARLDLGSLYLRRHQYEQASREFEQVLAKRPRDAMAANNLAWCLAEMGKDLDGAKRRAEQAVQLAPEAASALDTLGWICCKRKEYGEAAKNLARSLELRPESPTTHYHLAVALAAQGKTAEAKASLSRAFDSKIPFPEADTARTLLKQLGGAEQR